MDRCAVFVDAGWFLSEAALALTGTASRGRIVCDYHQLALGLAQEACRATQLPLLRTYWYDAAPDGLPGPDHRAIARLSNVKLRLGRISHRQQKGVDALLILDLTTLARERAIASAVVISGDEDIREGIVAAQSLGVQVALASVAPEGNNSQSIALLQEADDQLHLSTVMLRRCMTAREPERPDEWRSERQPDHLSERPSEWQAERQPERQPVAVAATSPSAPSVRRLVFSPPDPNDGKTPREYGFAFGANYADTLTDDELRMLQREAPEMPANVVAQLFRDAEQAFGPLRGQIEMRRELKNGFWDHVMRRRNG